MLFKKIMQYFLVAVLLAGFLFFYAKWFERRNIFFPYRQITATPDNIGIEYEDVYFDASDGVTLNGWFMPATGARGTILFFHGNAGNIGHRLEMIRLFHGLGFNVFIFDYRGYGKSKGSPSEKGTYIDASAAYGYLLTRGDVDKEKIILYGKSLGGSIAVDLAVKNPPGALISESAFTSTVDMGKEIYPFLPLRHMITMKYDTISKVGEVTSPKLIIHSEEDEIVPFHHGRRIFERSTQPKEFYRMRGGHNDAVMLYEDEYEQHIDSFLRKSGF